ncbi:dioxygenase family protein [Paractinoplanes brasiliensis]|uniref:Dioxygenase-like protein n=1 Tax=Paractinoplanes brasiliensis TaxID=52695 RepID=A0A4R6K067_9ACTN|nr:hypothetical protein [Actinoplanes brasiliensis]TDO40956.1 dioxygenase-like protein [Actinoplanes brasiliensis]GID26024.1 hypothetical protein Abr02nite_10070 [Actinoplanes brasiliensis]
MTTQVKEERQHHGAGLAVDFPVLRRRRMMGLVNGVTVATLAGADSDALTRSGIVRDDIRRSFGTASGVARGVPLTVRLRLVSANSGRPLAGHALYLWHADRDGAYSLHSPGLDDQNYLRGLQVSDEQGWVMFSTIFPGTSEGRWPHLSYEISPAVAAAPERAGQVGLPADACVKVYTTTPYAENAAHLALASPVADDGGELAMATVTGDLERGFAAVRTISI